MHLLVLLPVFVDMCLWKCNVWRFKSCYRQKIYSL